MDFDVEEIFTEEFISHAKWSYSISCRDEFGKLNYFAKSGCGDTLLHVAVGSDWENPPSDKPFHIERAVQFLVDEGLDINAQGDFMQTPLLLASKLGHRECVALLLELGADPTIPDHLGNLPKFHSDWTKESD